MNNTSFFFSRLATQPYVLTFAGQSTPWTVAVEEMMDDPDLSVRLEGYVKESEALLSAVAPEILATFGTRVDLLGQVANPARLGKAANASVSVPGIFLSQIGALFDAQAQGLDISHARPAAVLGHSQGVLAAEAVAAVSEAATPQDADKALVQLLAISRLIGVAGTRVWRGLGGASAPTQSASPMMSVKDATAEQIAAIIERLGTTHGPISVGVRNSRDSFVISGYPQDLERFATQVGVEHKKQDTLRKNKVRGGRVFSPTLEYLEVTIPFHSSLLEPAVALTVEWAKQSGLDTDIATRLAHQVLVGSVEWDTQVNAVLGATDPTKLWFVDLGPGQTAGKLTLALAEGSGAGIVDATTLSARNKLGSQDDFEPARTQDWSSFAPTVVETEAGKKASTAFTELTGRSPILLAGMTPTTVDPEIVAAAANAGYWAELAGGGQVTEEVFDTHMHELEGLLDEGRTVEFNAMFMDRYLWNLQFGSSRIVPKKRASGAPIDGVVVSAGIPELDEAVELISSLRADGLPYVAFKPGTVDQIRQVVRIAAAVAPVSVIMEVEGGVAGGHHSWESLDDLLMSTYSEVRKQSNIVLVAGGGIGTPERAADYISGEWSAQYGLRAMPVDGVLVGTAAMTAKESHTSPQVKQALVETPGMVADSGANDDDPFAPLGEKWVPAGSSVGGMASGLSHLRADIYELENSSAAAGRLIAHTLQHPEELVTKRAEIIEALDKTAKPYFGDVESMTYVEWGTRFAQLSYPWADPTYVDRFLHLLHRIEARVSIQEKGEFTSLFASVTEVENPTPALEKLASAYPQAAELKVSPVDAAWFPGLLREYPKPLPFVPAIDGDLLRWWGQDQLWQSEDSRYSADSVRVIPGPISVAGITTVNEPIADILGRFDKATIERAENNMTVERAESSATVERAERAGGSTPPAHVFSPLQHSATAEDFIRNSPHISWVGHLTDNPAFGTVTGDKNYEIREVSSEGSVTQVDLDLHLDTFWDNDADGGTSKHAVRHIVIPLTIDAAHPEQLPIVDRARLPKHVYNMLAATAGIGNTAITGDDLSAMPEVDTSAVALDASHPFGIAHSGYTFSANLGADHEVVTGGALPEQLQPAAIVPDAFVGPAWPAIYAALGSVYVDGFPVIEGLLNAVHLDHLVEFAVPDAQILSHVGERVELTSWAENYRESASGRVVTIHVEHRASDGTVLINEVERFAIRGRAFSSDLPVPAADFGGVDAEISDTPRRLLRRVSVTAPHDMTAFARTSGDFNPIHTSYRGAAVSGLQAPLVHGMWLSATAQHAVQALDEAGSHYEIVGWTYNMYGMVQLGEQVEISIERVGKVERLGTELEDGVAVRGGLVLEVTARINKAIVSRASVITRAPKTAYVYPGQGIQKQGMVLDERAASPAARATWERADKLTREKLGFSILAVVRDNPKQLTAGGVTYVHPEGLLNLTQFTQVALATVAFAQTARLREQGVIVEPSYFAGHSLGEYDALSSFAQIIPLETVLELVFHRGSTMHHLIERDENGRSNYRMGALRPNQFGLGDADVKGYIEQVSRESGEFLEIVNYNLAGAQYAVAGTIAGLRYLRKDSEERAAAFGGKPPFMLVPGIDVPFHSTRLRKGVPEFRDKLDELLPKHIDYQRLVGRYIPNLVAKPFEMTKDFAREILKVVPSERLESLVNDDVLWDATAADEQKLGRVFITELLSWQFASPVRWIETQALLFASQEQGGLGIEQYVEVGLGNAPTLANLGAKTLTLPAFADRDITVYNVGRDALRVSMTDTDPDALVKDSSADDGTAADTSAAAEASAPAQSEAPAAAAAPAAPAPVADAPAAASVPAATSGERPADLAFKASDGIKVLIAHATKIRLEQIGDADTTDTLTNGVSSRRNQLLMDISSELGVASVDGAAEATIKSLSAIVDKVAPNYQPFGQVVGEAVRDRLKSLFGAAGVKASAIKDRVVSIWQLGEGWSAWVTASLLLDTREGASTRGGDLAVLSTDAVSTKAVADKLIDAAVEAVAAAHGVAVSLPSAGGAAGGAVVDSAALTEFSDKLIGDKGLLATAARFVLKELGISTAAASGMDSDDAADAANADALQSTVEAELGSDWPAQVTPKFDERKAVLFDDRWATAREDLARLYFASEKEAAVLSELSFVGAGSEVAGQAAWYQQRASNEGNSALAQRYADIAAQARQKAVSDVLGQVAVVTGVSANSIAAQVVARLLAGGVTVVATSHSFKQSTVQWVKKLYRENAVGGAKLWLLPANLSSYRDVDAVVNWIGTEQKETVGATVTVIKPAYEPDLFFPFAAPPVHGSMADSGELFESQARLMLWGVERAIAGLAAIGSDSDVAHKLHVVLPGSPNRGIFGGDGAYGEVKSAFDAILNRSRVEKNWASRVTFAHPKIGWVRGTGLMKGNDPLVEVVESEGIHTYSTEQISEQLVALASPSVRKQSAENGPVEADLTGGLGNEPIDLKALWAKAEERKNLREQALGVTSPQGTGAAGSGANGTGANGTGAAGISTTAATAAISAAMTPDPAAIKALPSPHSAHQPAVDLSEWKGVTAKPEDQIVIVSIGELGPWGSGRTRLDAELGIHSDGSVELTAAGILELAWNMGLLSWADSPKPGWYDVDGNLVPEEEIAARYGDEVTARSGIRPFDDGMGNDYRSDGHAGGTAEEETAIFLDNDVTFSVASEELAKEYVNADPEHTTLSFDEEQGEWQVTRIKGALARVPRRATMTRTVGGQFPRGFDPTKWGIPASMIGDVDPIALWNIVTTVDAYISAGFSPVEILQNVHPSMVASTQGTGFGGMASMRKLYLDRFLGKEYPTDILQEALPNVVAAHVMQSYIGGYGNMIQPVSACATAAISLEEGYDKIKLGKADFVVTGAIDDIGVESVNGFGYMNATADSAKMYAKGIEPRFFSRAGDRRRGGFLESQGGGTVLLTRGDIALRMGLPVAGVVGYVHSFADGAHTSIPAPGLGAVAAARGGASSALVRQLGALGVTPDDIAVVSKHDTSTNANDPNEAELHNVVAHAIGRTQGNPLYVVSQKTLTGHAKGGAAIFQINGLTQMFSTGVIPANAALDCLDPKMRADDFLVWLRSPLAFGARRTLKAGLATSLGFGHVSGFVAVVHPGAFEASVAAFAGDEALAEWRAHANERLEAGARRRQKGMMGAAPLYEAIDNRRFTQDRHQDSHQIEIAMLLDPSARLSASGEFDMTLGK